MISLRRRGDMMEKQKLIDMRNSLTMLPVLQQRLQKLEQRIAEAEKDMQEILRQYNAEAVDVEQMKKDSLSNTLLKLIKRYEGKLNKETQEMLTVKMEYDKASDRVSDLQSELYQLNSRIQILLDNKQAYETELKQREDIVKSSITSKAYLIYRKLQDEREKVGKQLVEIDEAKIVAHLVLGTAQSALDHLQSAEGWATYDIWARGGVISHMAKYSHIDNAQADFNRLSYQIKDLEKELSDIMIFETTYSVGIDATTRVFDFWFDNIFTDLNVRDKIRADKEEVSKLIQKIKGIIMKLEEVNAEALAKLETVENNKKELLINNY
jgi:chromosome segregation ATPase